MSNNIVRLEGLESVWELVDAWLKIPPERKIFEDLVSKEQAKTVTIVSEQMTKGVIQTLDALKKIAEMYAKLGYPVDKIQKVMGPRVENTINVFNKLSYLKHLKERGTIAEATVYRADTSERRKAERIETRPEILFKILEKWHKGYVCDISETGLQILADKPLRPSEKTTIRLRDLTNSKEVNMDGVVVWQKEVQTEDHTNRLGLHFQEMLPVPASCFVPERISIN